jgi:phospholipid transport system transporter-binding protein
MAQITQIENRWEITGDIEMDNANALLMASNELAIVDNALVDFSNVKEIDTAAISLILEWTRRAIEENKQLKFVNLPANLNSLTQLYGVADLIN